jgi:hypothetical protein
MSAAMSAALRSAVAAHGVGAHAQAVSLLTAAGYDAQIRKVRLDSFLELKTVAVCIALGDRRVRWTMGDRPAPVGHQYRNDENGKASVTLFSGWLDDDIARFVAQLTAPARGLHLVQEAGDPHPEWDPHCLSEHESRRIEAQMDNVSELMSIGPTEHSDRRPRRALSA